MKRSRTLCVCGMNWLWQPNVSFALQSSKQIIFMLNTASRAERWRKSFRSLSSATSKTFFCIFANDNPHDFALCHLITVSGTRRGPSSISSDAAHLDLVQGRSSAAAIMRLDLKPRHGSRILDLCFPLMFCHTWCRDSLYIFYRHHVRSQCRADRSCKPA